jgi:hypothetical protein
LRYIIYTDQEEGLGSYIGSGLAGNRPLSDVLRKLRGSVVIDKSFVIMALACAAAPFLGAGIYVVMHLF